MSFRKHPLNCVLTKIEEKLRIATGKIPIAPFCDPGPWALIEGQLSVLASLAKTEKCPRWQNFYYVSPKYVYYFDVEGLSVFL